MKTKPTKLILSATSALLLFGLAANARAQTATQPATATPATATPATDDVVTLSVFSVIAEPDRGYAPSETMTGSRIATKIIDLPYVVNVMTSEYLEDFAIFDLGDNLSHIGGFTGLDIGGTFTIRGFAGSSQLRDGFLRLGRYGSSNIDRMEIIKGSNAAIYGRSSPGGMVNMISKMPKDREYYSLKYTYGDYHTRRATLEATGPLFSGARGRTSYLFTASQFQKGFNDIEYARNRNHEYYLAVKHVFPDASALTFQWEHFLQERHALPSGAPVVTDMKGTTSNLDDEVVGFAKNLALYTSFGPNSELNRGNRGITLTYEKRFSPIWSLRAGSNIYQARRWDWNQNTGFGSISINRPPVAGVVPPITTTRGATPRKGLIFEDGGGFQGDLLATYKTGSVKHRTLMTVDINDIYRINPIWDYAQSGATIFGQKTVRTDPALLAWDKVRVVTLNPDYTPVGPIEYFTNEFEWGKEVVTRSEKPRTTWTGGLIRHQSNFLNDRLLAYAGVRFDNVRFRARNMLTDITTQGVTIFKGQSVKLTENHLKPNLGVNYKLTPALRVFANYSESYGGGQVLTVQQILDPTFKTEVANGYDYGFKGSFLNDRLNFTVTGFYAIRENVRVNNVVEEPEGSGNFLTINLPEGDQLVRGYDIDLNWRVTDEVSTGLSWARVHSIYTDFGSANPNAVGRPVNAVAPENGSAYIKYAARQGRLKGFSANLGVTHMAATPNQNPAAGDFYKTEADGTRTLVRTTRQWALRSPSFTLWNAGLHYQVPRQGRFDHKFSLNVNNIFDKDYLLATRAFLGERRAFSFTYTLGFGGKGR